MPEKACAETNVIWLSLKYLQSDDANGTLTRLPNICWTVGAREAKREGCTCVNLLLARFLYKNGQDNRKIYKSQEWYCGLKRRKRKRDFCDVTKFPNKQPLERCEIIEGMLVDKCNLVLVHLPGMQ
jgi:hypothetical protein